METQGIATLHYQGHLDDVSQLDAALGMIREECDAHGWTCSAIDFPMKGRHFVMREGYAYEVEVDLHWRGWSIEAHERCSSLVLAFDDDGWLMLSFDHEDVRLISHDLSVTTGYAPPRVHAQICALLRRLQNQFARQEFAVDDPTGYFDSQDKVQLLNYWGSALLRASGSEKDAWVDISDMWFCEDAQGRLQN
jgi:hypothetical protein